MMRGVAVLVIAVGAGAFAQRGEVVKPRSNIKNNNIVAEPDGRLRCVTPEGKACTAQDVQDLASKLTAESGIKSVALAAPDGTLRCQTADGKACTAAALNQVIVRGWDPQQSKAIVGRPASKQ